MCFTSIGRNKNKKPKLRLNRQPWFGYRLLTCNNPEEDAASSFNYVHYTAFITE